MDDTELKEQERHDARMEAQKRERETCEEMRDLLSQARIRLDQYVGMCACPGETCVSACRECNQTQDLINRIRTFMRSATSHGGG